MTKYICFIGLLLSAFSLYSCDYQSPSVIVEQQDDGLIIKSGKHTIYARELGEKHTEEFLLVGGTGRGMYPFTAHFSVIPTSRVEQIKRKSGKGTVLAALESSDYVRSMFLYPVHQTVGKELLEADGLAMTSNYPVVRMSFVEINVTKHTVKVLGREVEEARDEFAPCYLVVHLEIVHENYSQNL